MPNKSDRAGGSSTGGRDGKPRSAATSRASRTSIPLTSDDLIAGTNSPLTRRGKPAKMGGPPPIPASAAAAGAEPQSEPISLRVKKAAPRRLDDEILAPFAIPTSERWRTVGRLGVGGVGIVDMLVDRSLGRRVARKTIRDEVRDQTVLVRSFVREARITASLEHPSVVPIHDVGIDDNGRAYLTMRVIEGRDLASVLADEQVGKTSLGVGGLLEVVIKVCDALKLAHEHGVIHADMKPGNIMLGDFGEVYITDWGFALLMPNAPLAQPGELPPLDLIPTGDTGLVVGTAHYMPPEQALGHWHEMGPWSDVFSVGAVLYQAITGRTPYRGKTYSDTINMAARCNYDRLDGYVAAGRCPRELARIVHRAMSPKRGDRYQSIELLKQDLVALWRGVESAVLRYEPGQMIVREGEVAHTAFIVLSGECEAFRTERGVKVPLRKLKAGETFGELGLLSERPRTASVAARTAVELAVVTRDQLDREMNSVRPWMAAIIRTLAERFLDLERVQRQNTK